MKNINNKENLVKTEGIAYINKENDIIYNMSTGINSLDLLEFPIISNNSKIKNFVTISGSRGCPYLCKFCAAGKLSGNKYRFRSVQNIIDEILFHYKNNITNFGFIDDTITALPFRIVELCNEISKRNINITWNAESRIDFAADNKKLLKEMHNCGCNILQFGIEAGSDEKLLSIKKGITVDQIKKALDNTFEAGIQVSGSMVVGLPNETISSITETFEYAKMLQKTYQINIIIGWFVPYPGTTYREELLRNNPENFNLSNYEQFTTLHPNFIIKNNNFYEYQDYYFNTMVHLMKNNHNLMMSSDLNIDIFKAKNDYL
jgi:radical SAM superfamily enzyme YgiQ (UPF0313 family)